MAAGRQGTVDEADSNDFFASSAAPQRRRPPSLTVQEMRGVKERALKAVTVPQDVVDLLVDMRTHLQEKTEPPVYVSDRRLVKIVAMLRVMAYTCGRSQVNARCSLCAWGRVGLVHRCVFDANGSHE